MIPGPAGRSTPRGWSRGPPYDWGGGAEKGEKNAFHVRAGVDRDRRPTRHTELSDRSGESGEGTPPGPLAKSETDLPLTKPFSGNRARYRKD